MINFSLTGHNLNENIGFKVGASGTHLSRTAMISELESVLCSNTEGKKLKELIVEGNILGKQTLSSRVSSYQRLKQLYLLDEKAPIYRVFRYLWKIDPDSLPQLAVLAALGRDPLLRATMKPVIGLANGSELMRDSVRNSLAHIADGKLSKDTIDKVVRNTSSTWTQSGHLKGRIYKRRKKIKSGPVSLAYAVWLAQNAGFFGSEILDCGWITVLDFDPTKKMEVLEKARVAKFVNIKWHNSEIELDAQHLQELC